MWLAITTNAIATNKFTEKDSQVIGKSKQFAIKAVTEVSVR